MKITYTEFAAPNLRGTTAHVPPALGASLIATGFAVACPLPRRGQKGWLEARLEQSNLAGPPDPQDVSANFVQGTEWGVKDRVTSQGQVLILKRSGSETTFFATPPPDCPESVIARFEQLGGKFDGAAAAQLERAKAEQARYESKIANAKRW